MKQILERLMRRRARVYIFPTRMGGYCIGLIALMFMLSIGYSNNLLLIFTIALFGLNILWVIGSHLYLSKLLPGNIVVDDSHFGNPTLVSLRWKRWPLGNKNWDLTLINNEVRSGIRVLGQEEGRTSGELALPSRGFFRWSHLLIKSDRPFGLYQSWIYFPVNVTAYSYPSVLKDFIIPGPESQEWDGAITGEKKGDEGLRGLNQYQGEGSRRISWKHYAKSGELLVKEGEELRAQLMRLKVNLPEDEKKREHEISRITSLLVYCHRQEIPFIYEGKTQKGPGSHLELLKECLRELAQI